MKIFFSGRIPKDTGGSAAVSRRARFQYPFHRQTAQRVKWSASGATKGPAPPGSFLTKHRNTPKTGKFSGYFSSNRCSRPARKAGTRGDTVPRSKGHSPLERSPRALRLESVHITREHGCLADVVQLKELHGQALQTDAQTAVRAAYRTCAAW